MRTRLISYSVISVLALAGSACDRVTSPSIRDAGMDSLASRWEHVDAGATNYNGVAGSAPDNVFIVGDQGTILHWDGISLSREESGTLANLRGVAVVDATLAYAVGDTGTVLCRRDGLWAPMDVPSAAVLNAVCASTNFAVAVGEQGTILSYRQGAWGPVPSSTTNNYYAVSDSNDGILVAGAQGILVRVDPNARTVVGTPASIPGYTKVVAGAARHASGAYLVGVDGGIFFWSGGSATRIQGLPQSFLRAVSMDPATSTAWIVGHEGLVASLVHGATPTLVPTPDDRWVVGVYAASSTDLWIVGRSGLILRGPPGVRDKDGGPP